MAKRIIKKLTKEEKNDYIQFYSGPYWEKDKIKVTEVNDDGFLITINDTEYFCTYDKFPWFEGAAAEDIKDVLGNADHLMWLDLDMDLKEEHIRQDADIIRPVTNS